MNVLVINSGSSSLKFQLIDFQTTGPEVKAQGLCERIGIDQSKMQYRRGEAPKTTRAIELHDHEAAVKAMLTTLTSPDQGVIASLSEIKAIGHRVVHGGERFSTPAPIDAEVKTEIKKACLWGPLHNPANLLGIEVCERLMPGIPQVAVFDTAFHQTMPREAYLYALPYDLYERLGVRRYGFHGTSHDYVSKRAASVAGVALEASKIIVCHLGNGSSVCAVKNGQSIDTSMGLTPLAGLPMGTRTGDIDPAIAGFLADVEGLSLKQIDHVFNKESGVLGLSGVSSDFRDLAEAKGQGHERAALALDVFRYALRKYIGAYYAALGGLDVLAFTAGIGENDDDLRADLCRDLACFGVDLDEAKNKGLRGREALISKPSSTVRVVVIPTNEELAIANQTMAVLGLKA